MKKLFFLSIMLASVAASATVTVTPLSVNYNAKTVTFHVVYSSAYNNRAWVWIDLCPVSGVTPTTFQTAVISAASATGNNVIYSSTNTRGFFVTASPATVTATLSNVTGKFNWCAHGSDYPPNAVINAAGGYTLKGTPPFTINGTKLGDGVKTFGAGTCINSITDLTGNPDGVVPALPSLSSPNSPSRCSAGAVTLFVTASGGTTTAMTYTWNIGGTTYTNQTNSYTTGSLSSSAAYSVKVKNANNCESNTVNGSITVNYPGTNGNPFHATCGCASGTTNCSGTCRTTGNYTQNNGACTGGCNTAYVQQYNQCGTLINDKYSTYTNTGCTTPNYTSNDGACTGNCNQAYVQLRNVCGAVINSTYSTYTNTGCTGGCGPTYNSSCTGASQKYNTDATFSNCSSQCSKYATGWRYYNWYTSSEDTGNWCGCYRCN